MEWPLSADTQRRYRRCRWIMHQINYDRVKISRHVKNGKAVNYDRVKISRHVKDGKTVRSLWGVPQQTLVASKTLKNHCNNIRSISVALYYTSIESHCACYRRHCAFYRRHCAFYRRHCAFYRRHCAFYRKYCTFYRKKHCTSTALRKHTIL